MRWPLAWRHTLEAARVEACSNAQLAANRLRLLETSNARLGETRLAKTEIEGELSFEKANHFRTKDLLDVAQREVMSERQMRRDAQRGLVVYVRALEAFEKWLRETPPDTPQELIEKLNELGLWGVRAAYDPLEWTRVTVG